MTRRHVLAAAALAACTVALTACGPDAPPAPTSKPVPATVNPGSFCAPGDRGVTAAGTPMMCVRRADEDRARVAPDADRRRDARRRARWRRTP